MVEETGHSIRLSKNNLKNIGHEVNDRIRDDAVIYMAVEEQERMKEVWRNAKLLARHAGRQTIKEEDVRLAYKLADY